MNKIKELLTVYEKLLGYKIPAPSKEAAGAKRIFDAGYTQEDSMACYRHFKKQLFWKDKHLSLTYIASNMAPYMKEYAPKDKPDDDALERWFNENN